MADVGLKVKEITASFSATVPVIDYGNITLSTIMTAVVPEGEDETAHADALRKMCRTQVCFEIEQMIRRRFEHVPETDRSRAKDSMLAFKPYLWLVAVDPERATDITNDFFNTPA